MNISAVFIRRPVMTTLVMLAIVVFGVLGFRQLPISDLPQVDFPTLMVMANLPGANPETMATTVATPLERQFATIAGIDSISSSSSTGQTTIVIQFNLTREIDAAAQDVQTAVATAMPLLPPMPTRPTVRKANPADAPVLYLFLSSKTQPLHVVDDYAETLVAQRISMVDGVAQVSVFGAKKYAVRAQVNPDRLAALGIGIDQVAQAIQAGSVKKPTGTLQGEHLAYSVQANDQRFDAAQFRPLIVAVRRGVPVRLEQVADVIDSVENDKVANWTGDGRAIVLAVQRQPNTNTVQVIENVHKQLRLLADQIPGSVRLGVLYDRSLTIRESVTDVEHTLGITVVLVVLVIFAFLRNPVATLIPSLSLPLSLLGTFFCMAWLGFSLNNLSLMALTLSVGYVVDDAIVVLENIVRHIEMGKTPMLAALDGTREVGFTIVSMTVSLIAVFTPIIFMGGIVGRLFREFAITITCAIAISGFVSVSLIPMLCSRMLKAAPPAHGRLYRITESVFDEMRNLYAVLLRITLRFRFVVLVASIALVWLTVKLFGMCSKGFIPTVDTNQIMISTEGPQDISFDAMQAHQRELSDIIARHPAVNNFMCAVGVGGASNTGNAGRLFVTLKPRNQRTMSADQVAQDLRRQFSRVVGIKAFMQNPPSIRIGGMMTKGLYQCTVQSLDLKALYSGADKLLARMRDIPGVQDASTDLQTASLEADLVIDRDKASALGLTARQIDTALAEAFGAQQISTIYTERDEYKVIIEVAPRFYKDPTVLSKIYVRGSHGRLVPLSTVAHLKTGLAPLLVNHLGQLPAATISFNLAPGTSLGSVVEQVQRFCRETLPRGVTASFQGNAQAFQSSVGGLLTLLVVAILVIYIVLGILYESFAHPITILSGLPSAGVGAIATLMLFKVDLDIYGFLGLLMLIGIVKKNAIMMIDHALEAERNEGKSPAEAIEEACLVRFRPITMTTVAAIMGSLPIAVSMGGGAEARQPLGLAVVGGLVVSQLLTLFITPVVYLYIERISERFGGRRGLSRPRILLDGGGARA
ncbi:MAG: acriflavine resistance protein B [Proteobacteria bacterium]|nr:acriflavine resistance protein B [Pseudomonadota bacterium]